MPLNPHTFPLVPIGALAPELATRSGMGGHDAYALQAPTDRLLPFVLTRAMSYRNAPWLSCAWIEHADTKARIATLVPTGSISPTTPVPSLGLVVQKLTDNATKTEYFTYEAALIPDLEAALPCGVPLRLIVDNAYQSPRFYAIDTAAKLRASHMLMEWFHSGPLQGVPYGRGFRQQLFIPNGSLQFLDHRVVQESTKGPNGGPDRLDSIELFQQRAFAIEPVPAYLADAAEAGQAVKTLLVDGLPWRFISAKATTVGNDGGRWTLAVTVEDETPLLSRGCKAPALPTTPYDPAYMPRGWRCGDATDTTPDFQPTGVTSCELDDNGDNTGYVLTETEDLNPNSPTAGQTGAATRTLDTVACPLPVTYYSAYYADSATRSNCQPGFLGTTVLFEAQKDMFTSRLSQADADLKAYDYVQAGKQAYANQQGVCAVGRRVELQNIAPSGRVVRFDLVRSDTAGDAIVQVQAEAVVYDGQNTFTGTFRRFYTIPAGASSLLNNTLNYSGATLVEFINLEIIAVTPTDYLF